MFEIGDTLREARIRQGLTLKDVEDSLKIRAKYLQALEDDDFEVLPGRTFVRAFLRTYATYLGLDADVLVAEYETSQGVPSASHRNSQVSGLPRSAGPRTRGRRSQPNYVVVAVVALIVLAVLAIAFGNRGEKPAVIDPESVTSSTSTPAGGIGDAVGAGAATDESVAGVVVAMSAGAAEVPAADSNPDKLDLVIDTVQNRCWIVVREESAAGRTLYSGTLAEGERLTYSADGRIWLRIGDPSAVRLYVDGGLVEVPQPYGDFVLSDAGLQRVE